MIKTKLLSLEKQVAVSLIKSRVILVFKFFKVLMGKRNKKNSWSYSSDLIEAAVDRISNVNKEEMINP